MTSMLISVMNTFWNFSLDLIPLIFRLLGVGLLLLLIAGALAPFESLGWFAGWSGQTDEQEADQLQRADTSAVSTIHPPRWEAIESSDLVDKPMHTKIEHYLIYLSGIGAISGDYLEPNEIELCDKLAARFPDTAVVKDVFPYAMNNRGLTSHRFFAWMWRRIKQLKVEGRGLLANLINLRNSFQALVSADSRYGPIYNFGTAEVIRDGLLRQGYRVGSGKPVTIIGYSGGAQIAVGAAEYLQQMLGGVPLWIISLGGMLTADPGLDHITHLYHLYGSKDPVQKLVPIFYAGRWPIKPHSSWNRAKAEGKITMIDVGPIGHNGAKGYLSTTSHLENGQRFLDRTVESITKVLELYNSGSYVKGTDERRIGSAVSMLSEKEQAS